MRLAIAIALIFAALYAFSQPMPQAVAVVDEVERPVPFAQQANWKASGNDATGLRFSVTNAATNYSKTLPVTATNTQFLAALGDNRWGVVATNSRGNIVGAAGTNWHFSTENWVRTIPTGYEQSTNLVNWAPVTFAALTNWRVATGVQWYARAPMLMERQTRTNGAGKSNHEH